RVWNRRLHRWGAAAVGIPFLVIICTGLLLQVKKQVTWVQPVELRTEAREPSVPYALLMERARAVPEAGISSWDDIDKVDVRPGKGMLKLIAKNHWEIQMDIVTGEVLQVAYRRSDFIETLHDMSWIHGSAKLWLGVPIGLIVLGLWLTGGYMWFVHLRGRRRARHAGASHSAAAGLLLMLVSGGGSLTAQQVPDTGFRPVVTAPAFPEGQGPRVLIDEGHHNFHRVDGRYGAFAGVLGRDGFRVGAHRGPFTEESLREADILVVANALGDDGPWVLPARPAFTAAEVAVVRRWVEGGGALLLVADHMPFPGSMLAMGRAFGIEWTDGFAMYSPEERGILTFRRADGSLASAAAAGARMRPGAVDS
ncbi:MAG: PepSY domain-containing protein, partial [Gemmatimonadales bacterium]